VAFHSAAAASRACEETHRKLTVAVLRRIAAARRTGGPPVTAMTQIMMQSDINFLHLSMTAQLSGWQPQARASFHEC
jgi:hypothetical protein